ncbi:unnamed protein product [Arabidopsis thaliana]|uniref:(thale cress) hypothetical protein n=1 Tax=Arabidopsis thaliana TaxID=3702 RepID=A0A7G2E6V8_ARATH|nr:unnamed protein product [Arabidopsis thaliana]
MRTSSLMTLTRFIDEQISLRATVSSTRTTARLLTNESPATIRAVAMLPRVAMVEKGECVICFEEWSKSDMETELPCKHKYHFECVEKWCEASLPPWYLEKCNDGDDSVRGEDDDGGYRGDEAEWEEELFAYHSKTREILVSESHEEVAMIIDHLFKRQDSEEYKTSRALYDICVSCNPDKWDELGDCILSLASSKEPVKAFHVFIDLPPVYKSFIDKDDSRVTNGVDGDSDFERFFSGDMNLYHYTEDQCHFVLASMNEIEGVVGTETKEIVRNAKMLITEPHDDLKNGREEFERATRLYCIDNSQLIEKSSKAESVADKMIDSIRELVEREMEVGLVRRGFRDVETTGMIQRGGTFTTWIVRKDEEAAAREEQIKREDARKRDAESRLEVLRNVRGLAPLTGGREGLGYGVAGKGVKRP